MDIRTTVGLASNGGMGLNAPRSSFSSSGPTMVDEAVHEEALFYGDPFCHSDSTSGRKPGQ